MQPGLTTAPESQDVLAELSAREPAIMAPLEDPRGALADLDTG
jgi:hypothetical protein